MAWPAIVGAIAGAAGSPSSALQQYALTKYQADRAHGESEWAFQRESEMANTAHQREVNDLRLAGLNPILSGMGGGGAPQAAAHPAPVPDFGSIAASRGGSVRNAFDMFTGLKSLEANLKLVDSERARNVADTSYRLLEQENIPVARKRMLAEELLATTTAQLRDIEAKHAKASLPAAQARGAIEATPLFQAGRVGGDIMKGLLGGLLGLGGLRLLTGGGAKVAPYIPSTRRGD